MFCKNCGIQIANNTAFCPYCGANNAIVSAPPQPVPRMANPAGPTPQKVLTMGIVGLALSSLGLPGLIVSIIALRIANEFYMYNGGFFGQALVGRRLAMPGLIVSIVMSVFWTIYLILYVGVFGLFFRSLYYYY